MVKKIFTREQILSRLRETEKSGQPIISAGCSAGIIAKCAERGGADLIVAYSTGKSRLMGLPTTIMGDSNPRTLEMCGELRNVTKNTPIIAGIEATDPTKMDLSELINSFVEVGYSGIINFPTIQLYGESRCAEREAVGLGFSREVEMIKIASEMNLFTMAYVFSAESSKRIAEAGVDCVVAHLRGTAGGIAGYKNVFSMEEAVNTTQKIIEAARSINSDIICLAHGGPFALPEDTKYLYEHTDAIGFVGASSIERIPIERAITEVVKKFKNIPIKIKKDL
ncbi:MAG: phosphoenolpyruvate hydrolase family protein [Candidatus Pacearchaeota archaeon]|jgi:predicted TIM-barrel enzyme|nr:phosphoenolpyruvate hydrolase family protein [Candidatus Pacearchaeota archaeon]